MLNNVVLVGRLTKDPETVTTEKGNKKTSVTLAIGRPYKNYNGEYETDFIRVSLWNGIAENTCEYCKKNDIIGVKGRIHSNMVENNEEKKYFTEVVAEKVTFLSSKRNDEKTKEN